MQSWYAVNQASETEAEVRIYDAIGAFGVSADRFINDIKGIKADTIHVRLNTPGGEVFDATTIYNALRNHGAAIVTHVDGLAASAGSVIAVAGDEVRMASNAYLMIHNAHGGVAGEASDMRRYADLLEKMNNNIADTYVAKAGKDREHWRGLMDAETWMTAEEAKGYGLVDHIDEPFSREAKNAFDFKIYNKVPQAVLEAFSAARPKDKEPTMDNPKPTPPEVPAAQAVPAVDAAAARRLEIEKYKTMTAEAVFENGRKAGIEEGRKAESERLQSLLKASPDNQSLAIEAFFANQTAESVKLAYDHIKAAEAEKKRSLEEAELELNRMRALAACGGYPIGVQFAPEQEVSSDTIDDPKAYAEAEWDRKQSVRRGFSSKENYVNFRVSELKGQFRGVTKSSR